MSGRFGQRTDGVGAPVVSFGRVSEISKPLVISSAPGSTNNTPGDGYTYYHFTSSGSLVIRDGAAVADVILVGGGAGGKTAEKYPTGTPTPTSNASAAGGGGAGGVVVTTVYLTAGTYPVTVGAGGAASTRGGDTIFNNIIALGGGTGFTRVGFSSGPINNPDPYYGFGATRQSPGQTPADRPIAGIANIWGGSSGGSFDQTLATAMPAVPGQGNPGGTGPIGAGGGGGAGSAGPTLGTGGDGLTIPQAPPSLPSKIFGGGGGSGNVSQPKYSPGPFAGGTGGGGAGGVFTPTETGTPTAPVINYPYTVGDGTANRGGGGGGGGALNIPPSNVSWGYGGSGGSGTVIIRIRNGQ